MNDFSNAWIFFLFHFLVDNQLSNREFVAVMKNRLLRGLEKPKDTGFVKLIHSILKCAKDTKPVLLDLWKDAVSFLAFKNIFTRDFIYIYIDALSRKRTTSKSIACIFVSLSIIAI